MGAPIPISEPQRLQALHELDILDTPLCPQLQSIAQIAASILDAPIALVSLVDSDRQWFKAKVGLDVAETCRDYAFCAYAILQSEPLIVNDALTDERFDSNPLVTSDPKIRFYAGAPLKTTAGHNLGTLCVIDTKPRSMTAEQESTLGSLASLAVETLETQQKLRAAEGHASQLMRLHRLTAPNLSSFGHELRTPLNHIIGFADLMKATLPPDTEGQVARNREYLEIIQRSGAHLLGLIDNVIRYEQAAFEGALDVTRVDANAVLAEIVQSFVGTVGAKQQSLRFVPFEGEAVVLGEPTALRQIAINLIGNAAKHCPTGASIDVRLYRDGLENRLCIAVEDDGPGLPEDLRDGLCRPFARGRKALDGGEDGFGLGLHITKRLSEAMKGSLVFEQGRRGGTSVILRLPVAESKPLGETRSTVNL